MRGFLVLGRSEKWLYLFIPFLTSGNVRHGHKFASLFFLVWSLKNAGEGAVSAIAQAAQPPLQLCETASTQYKCTSGTGEAPFKHRR